MTEKVEGQEGQSASEEVQFTEIETRAADQGWRPKDEWDGEPDDWRTAREFLDRGEFFKRIEDQNRTIKELRKTQVDMTKHLELVRKTEFKRALDSLKAQKKDALEEGDVGKVVAIDDEIADIKVELARPSPQVQVDADPQMNPVFVAWKDRNNWYETNEAMRAYADRLGNQLTGSPSEILVQVERAVKKEFAHKFENPRRVGTSSVEGSATRAAGKKEPEYKLNETERQVMQRLVRQGALTEEQYIKDLKAAKARE